MLAALAVAVTAAGASPQSGSCTAVDLKQGWNADQSQRFWFTSQGSRLMQYSWFVNLEVADPASQTLIRDRSNIDRYGYIWAPASAVNPDGLPVGFVKDVELPTEAHPGQEHFGFTCAACHTGSLNIGGQRVIVEGGPALSDFWLFLNETAAGLRAALTVPDKFDRFSKKVLHDSNPTAEKINALKMQMQAKLDDIQTRLNQNASANPFGYGRVDAFGHIFTRVLAQDFGVAANAAPPYGPKVSAPVSYPFIWDTPQHDLVQWNGSAPNSRLLELGPLGRNIGEVLGVFGELEVKGGWHIPFMPWFSSPPKFKSSAKIQNLMMLEETVRTLWSPRWPENCYPLAPAATLARGEQVYRENCVGCHVLLQDPERTNIARQIKAQLVTLDQVVTDPTMAMNFAERQALTGPIEGSYNLLGLNQFGKQASGYQILLTTVNGLMFGSLSRPNGVQVNIAGLLVNPADQLKGFQRAAQAARTPRYKARPLDGIWATAPYLHNGSVPTLADLLTPEKDRPAVFYVGSHDFDPVKVGLVATPAPGTFLFNTSPQGNWNNGHPFGTQLSPEQKKDLLEFLKTL
ncbi:MAG TPA: di-heme-cytochrome C peroxidase [Candidatus Sulfopaludibacter sp.]|jgi:mono/diheme cytochrome c family protein|nr:di-heme-cytochrome C peroxidase [Candidatus Sulfopaludibacter sp.]